MADKLVYAHSLKSSQEGFDRNKSFLSGDFDASELINEELSDSMSFYYGEFSDNGDLACERPLISKLRLGGRANKLCIDRIFTTGLTQEEADIYIIIGGSKNPSNSKVATFLERFKNVAHS